MTGDVADVSMPEGIEVDEAAAYFGVFESSDTLHQMMEMPQMEMTIKHKQILMGIQKLML